MTAVGFAACAAELRVSTEPWVFIDGLLFIALPYAVLYHLLLAFPSGVVHTPFERVLVGLTYVSAAVVHPVQVLFQDTAQQGLPENPLLISSAREVVSTISDLRFAIGLVLLSALALGLGRRWRATPRSQRAALAPVLLTGGLVMGLLGIWYGAVLAGAGDELVDRLEEARVISLSLVPVAFLAGLLRSRVAGATAVSELVARLGDPDERRRGLRDALANALGDPTLTLAYWLPERGEYVDATGQVVTRPAEGSGRLCTSVDLRGERVAAIIHDASLENERELVRAVAATAAVTLEVERLDAELRAKVEELRASRARLVESADAARRRIERDLHDGAQQRLVALALKLRLVQERADGDDQLTRDLKAARDELDAALDELRELARGIHPTVLSDRGLRAALEALARRAPIPVDLEGVPDERLPESVESTAYFVVSEALTDVAKYARASHVRVRVGRRESTVTLEVSDDCRGGADPDRGSGLRGLRERLSALEGRLEAESPPGEGTTVRAGDPGRRLSPGATPSNSGTFAAATPRGRSAASSLITADRFPADHGRRGLDRPAGRASYCSRGGWRSWRADARRLYQLLSRGLGPPAPRGPCSSET